jgi:hypothetical protein
MSERENKREAILTPVAASGITVATICEKLEQNSMKDHISKNINPSL